MYATLGRVSWAVIEAQGWARAELTNIVSYDGQHRATARWCQLQPTPYRLLMTILIYLNTNQRQWGQWGHATWRHSLLSRCSPQATPTMVDIYFPPSSPPPPHPTLPGLSLHSPQSLHAHQSLASSHCSGETGETACDWAGVCYHWLAGWQDVVNC